MNTNDKRHRLTMITKEIEEAKTRVSHSQRILSTLEKEQIQLVAELNKVSKKIRVSDHAVIRFLERKYKIEVEVIRKEILSKPVRDAINAGAKSIKIDGLSFKIANNIITTAI